MRARAAEHRSAPRRGDAGFTLVEAVVALGVFALAAVSLLSLNGGSVRAMTTLEDAAYARIVADNQIVTVLIATRPPALGVASGAEEQAGRTWEWTRTISPTSNAGMERIDVVVRREGTERTAASVSAFRSVE